MDRIPYKFNDYLANDNHPHSNLKVRDVILCKSNNYWMYRIRTLFMALRNSKDYRISKAKTLNCTFGFRITKLNKPFNN